MAGTEGCYKHPINTTQHGGTTTPLSTYRKDLERVAPHLVPVSTPDVVDPDEQTVIHHVHRLKKVRVATELFRQERTLLWPELERLSTVDPIEVFEHRTGVLFRFLFGVLSPYCTALEVIRLVDVLVWWKEVVHDDKVDLSAPGELDTM